VRAVSDVVETDEIDLCLDRLRASVALSVDFFTPATISISDNFGGDIGYLRFCVFEARHWEKLPSCSQVDLARTVRIERGSQCHTTQVNIWVKDEISITDLTVEIVLDTKGTRRLL
jgi:hypothetical protein